MANNNTIDRQFTSLFDEANALYRRDKLKESVKKCRELLNNPAALQYYSYHYRVMILLRVFSSS